MQKKHIIFGVSSIIVIGVAIFLLKKHSEKSAGKPTGKNTGIGNIPSLATTPYSNSNAVIENNNWDDAGGFRVKSAAGFWNYFDQTGKFKGQGTDDGGWVPAAN